MYYIISFINNHIFRKEKNENEEMYISITLFPLLLMHKESLLSLKTYLLEC